MSFAERIGDGDAKSTGRWRLNSGSEMSLMVPGIDKENPIRCVIDFSTAKFKGDKVVALDAHEDEVVIGYWDRGDISSRGIEADLHLIVPANEAEANVLSSAVKIGAIARSGTPIQVSVGASPNPNKGEWELIPPGKTVQVNARNYSGDGDAPLYVLRHGEIFEASIVTFGADSVTGRIAARRDQSPVKETQTVSMELKKALGMYAEKHHGLVARCVAEGADETTTVHKIDTALRAESEQAFTALKAENDKLKEDNARLSAQLTAGADEMEGEEEDMEGEGKPGETGDPLVPTSTPTDRAPGGGAPVHGRRRVSPHIARAAGGARQGTVFRQTQEAQAKPALPKTLLEAMNVEIKAGSTLKGEALRAHTINKYEVEMKHELLRGGDKIIVRT